MGGGSIKLFSNFIFFICLVGNADADISLDDPTKIAEKRKFTSLTREIAMDGITKVEAIKHIRRYFETSRDYHFGETIFNVKRLYQKMKFIFNQNNHYYDKYDENMYVKKLQEISKLFSEIDTLVQMAIELEEIDPAGDQYSWRRHHAPVTKEVDQPSAQEQARQLLEKRRAYHVRQKLLWHMRDQINVTADQVFNSGIGYDNQQASLVDY